MKEQKRMVQKLTNHLRLLTGLGVLCGLALLVIIPFVGGATGKKITAQVEKSSKSPDVVNEGVRLLIHSPSNSPLLILTKGGILPPTKSFQAELVIKNVSLKPIRVYAIRHDILAGGEHFSGCDLSMKASKKSMTFPGQVKTETIGGSDNFSTYLNTINISIDFVEFDDGTIWGKDTFQSAEKLNGWRTGAKEMRKFLLQTLETRGITVFSQEAELESFEITPPDTNKSAAWLQGFKDGANGIRARVKNTPNKGKHEEIKEAINKPFDASEGGK